MINWLQDIAEIYSTEAEYPWADSPDAAVFRHRGNRKWFALRMVIPRNRLGLPGEESIEILNVKCDPTAIGSFRAMPGVYPAYHMNKTHWLSVALDGSATEETIRLLLEISYRLTAPRPRKR